MCDFICEINVDSPMVIRDVFAFLALDWVAGVDRICDRMSWGDPDIHAMVSVGNDEVMMCSDCGTTWSFRSATLAVAAARYAVQMRLLFLEMETTGLHPDRGDRIVEIACIEIINSRSSTNPFHARINPERPVEAGAAQVHGMTRSSLQQEPVFASIAVALYDFVADSNLYMYNAPFRLKFLNAEFMRLGMPPLTKTCVVESTLLLARALDSGEASHLDLLCERYRVDKAELGTAGLLRDVERLAEVYLKGLPMFRTDDGPEAT